MLYRETELSSPGGIFGSIITKAPLVGFLLILSVLAPSAALAQAPIPASFMGMNTVMATDFPPLPIGMLGHPPTFAWGWIERSKGQFTWTGFDRYANDAASRGIDMVLTFGSTPGWAAANPSSCRVSVNVTICTSPPAHIQDWIDFVTAVIQHFNGVTAPHIRYYELWNEANATRKSDRFEGLGAPLGFAQHQICAIISFEEDPSVAH